MKKQRVSDSDIVQFRNAILANHMTISALMYWSSFDQFDANCALYKTFDIFFELDSRKGSLKQILDDIEEEKRKTRK